MLGSFLPWIPRLQIQPRVRVCPRPTDLGRCALFHVKRTTRWPTGARCCTVTGRQDRQDRASCFRLLSRCPFSSIQWPGGGGAYSSTDSAYSATPDQPWHDCCNMAAARQSKNNSPFPFELEPCRPRQNMLLFDANGETLLLGEVRLLAVQPNQALSY